MYLKKKHRFIPKSVSGYSDEGIRVMVFHSFGGIVIEKDNGADPRFDFGRRVTSFIGTEPPNFTDIYEY